MVKVNAGAAEFLDTFICYCIRLWSPPHRKDINLLEWLQGRPQK